MRNGSSVRVVSGTLTACFDWRVHGCVKDGLCMGQDLLYPELDRRSRLPCFAALVKLNYLRSLGYGSR